MTKRDTPYGTEKTNDDLAYTKVKQNQKLKRRTKKMETTLKV